ncbi:hypothetical protein [Pimelobacter simplex]|uniref:hypothetical protein n=1 Tax=Nocardioides simplex TaxID=2045 RepID=UPI0021506456|nr:hypothetical protein [Pimelobacter simplex]UUW91756.1 hypothetical protein M0M43_09790 [Pimelobacter simplex]UUW95584.1 hypothetical protein M0M48_28290 [Pimelobacter simplex]
MNMSTRRNLILEGIENCKLATSRAVDFKSHPDPAIQSLAEAIHFLSYGAQQIGLALSDEGRTNDLPL